MVVPDFAVLEIIIPDIAQLLEDLHLRDFSINLWPLLHVTEVLVRMLAENKRHVPKHLRGEARGRVIDGLLELAKKGVVTQAKQLFRTRFRARADTSNEESGEVILVANASEHWACTVVKPEGNNLADFADFQDPPIKEQPPILRLDDTYEFFKDSPTELSRSMKTTSDFGYRPT